jgi:purine-binding chemotaxis protein CheW
MIMDTPFTRAEQENLQAMKRAVLKARARILAKPHKRLEIQTDLIEVVEFTLSGETYAVRTSDIREVHNLKDVSRIPSTPAFIVGVISLRGQIIVVIDILRFFELPHAEFSVFNKVVIVEKGDIVLGIIADEVTGVRQIEQSTIHPSLATLAGKRAKFLRGITTDRVTILDVDKMLKDKDLLVNEQVDHERR